MSIHLSGGDALWRTASVPDYNADYTLMGVFRLTDLRDGVLLGVLHHDDNNDFDLLFLAADGTWYTRVGILGTGYPSPNAGLAVPDTWYYGALVRSGDDLIWYLGATPSSVVEVTRVTQSIAPRVSPVQILVLGNYTNSGASGFHTNADLAAWRLYAPVAKTLAQIKAELAYWPAVDTVDLWGDWRLQTAGSYPDLSGNGRDLSATGSPTTGDDPTLSFIGSGTGAIAHDGSGAGAYVSPALPVPPQTGGGRRPRRQPRWIETGALPTQSSIDALQGRFLIYRGAGGGRAAHGASGDGRQLLAGAGHGLMAHGGRGAAGLTFAGAGAGRAEHAGHGAGESWDDTDVDALLLRLAMAD